MKFQKGHKHSKKVRLKIALAHKDKKMPEKTKRKISETYKKDPTLHGNWKGKTINKLGYVLIHNADHPNSSMRNYVYEHRLIMEKHLGKYLKKSEVVHHIDGNPSNNQLCNLMLFPNQRAHKNFHIQLERTNA